MKRRFALSSLRMLVLISAHDFVLSFIAFVVAMLLRVGMMDFGRYQDRTIFWGLVFSAISMLIHRLIGSSSSIWRYASIFDVRLIAVSSIASIVCWLLLAFTVDRLQGIPRTFPLILWFIQVVALGAPRLIYRAWRDRHDQSKLKSLAQPRSKVLLVGAGDEAAFFIQALSVRSSNMQIVGVIDHKGTRIGRSIRGVPILDSIENIASVIDNLGRTGRRPDRVVICYPAAGLKADDLRVLSAACAERGVKLVRQPDVADLLASESDSAAASSLSEFLGRGEQQVSFGEITALIKGRRVVVTGAGGTIGSELVRQIAAQSPGALCLIEIGEFNLYQINMELAEQGFTVPVDALLCDVRNRAKVMSVFKKFKPDIVIHAAALKHVPILEHNPSEGVLTNVQGTINVADAAGAAKAMAFVLISTDKAVSPNNMLGATKRLAELYVRQKDSESTGAKGTRFVAVRFGNVIGSSGSVIPLFRRQLELGGPLTVTHPEMQRYFMTTAEAVALVLRAVSHGIAQKRIRGQVMVLKMGHPIKIVDVARQMIIFAGYVPDHDIKIEFVGLRPGETLSEDLFNADEEVIPDSAAAFMYIVRSKSAIAIDQSTFDGLNEAASRNDDSGIRATLADLMPSFVNTPAAGNEMHASVEIDQTV